MTKYEIDPIQSPSYVPPPPLMHAAHHRGGTLAKILKGTLDTYYTGGRNPGEILAVN